VDFSEDGEPYMGPIVSLVGGPVTISARRVSHDLTPEGKTCIATYVGDRLMAREIATEDVVEDVIARRLLEGPRRLLLRTILGSPGVQGRLYALIPNYEEDGVDASESDDAEGGWQDSASPSFEDVMAAEAELRLPEALQPFAGTHLIMPLGHIVRYEHDFKCGGDLQLESADILKAAMGGATHELVDRALAALELP
jgi:hypothetical protein